MAVRAKRRVPFRKQRGEDVHVIGGAQGARHGSEAHADLPADVRQVRTGRAELRGLRAFVAERFGDADGVDARLIEGEDDVARGDLAHEFVERVAVVVGVALRGPEVAAASRLLEGLVLFDPTFPRTLFALNSASY